MAGRTSEPSCLLLVGGEPTTCAWLAKMCRVEVADDSLNAWHVTRQARPDVAVVDLSAVGAEGLTLIQTWRADAHTTDFPVILLTTSAQRGQLLQCLAAGASSFLLKPFGSDELLACVRLELALHTTSRGGINAAGALRQPEA